MCMIGYFTASPVSIDSASVTPPVYITPTKMALKGAKLSSGVWGRVDGGGSKIAVVFYHCPRVIRQFKEYCN